MCVTQVCIDLHILPIRTRIEYKICLLTYKSIKNGKPAYLASLLNIHQPNNSIALRSQYDTEKLEEPNISQARYSNRCFSYCAPRLYNKLPLQMRKMNDIAKFKKELKTHIFSKAYDLQLRVIKLNYKV